MALVEIEAWRKPEIVTQHLRRSAIFNQLLPDLDDGLTDNRVSRMIYP
jgi:hypothetical protein